MWRKNTNKMQQYRCLFSIQMFNIDYCLDMFRASLCTSSGEKDHVLLHMGLFAATREDVDISRVVFSGVVYGMMSWGFLGMCVAV